MSVAEWIEFFSDKRFGWRFKIANLIMGDYLRNYLVVGCLIPLDHIIDRTSEDPVIRFCGKQAEKARNSVIDIMEM